MCLYPTQMAEHHKLHRWWQAGSPSPAELLSEWCWQHALPLWEKDKRTTQWLFCKLHPIASLNGFLTGCSNKQMKTQNFYTQTLIYKYRCVSFALWQKSPDKFQPEGSYLLLLYSFQKGEACCIFWNGNNLPLIQYINLPHLWFGFCTRSRDWLLLKTDSISTLLVNVLTVQII